MGTRGKADENRTGDRTSGSRRRARPTRLILPALPALAAMVFLAVLFWPSAYENPDVLRVGVLPDQSPEILRQQYEPLIDYLSAEVGKRFELVVPSNYGALLDMFDKQQVDIAYFGGLTYLKAHEATGARAVVMRDVDARFRSTFLARQDRPETTITDFIGKTLAFGSQLSTSGHLMPRRFLLHQGIEPESSFSRIVYSGAHDATAILVRDGKVDLGVANAKIVEAMFRDGRLRQDEVRVVAQTPTYVDYVWAMRVGIDTELYDEVVFAFLKLSPADSRDSEILKNLGAGGFLPVRDSQFRPLREIAITLGMLG